MRLSINLIQARSLPALGHAERVLPRYFEYLGYCQVCINPKIILDPLSTAPHSACSLQGHIMARPGKSTSGKMQQPHKSANPADVPNYKPKRLITQGLALLALIALAITIYVSVICPQKLYHLLVL